jgi:hypothetical protein
LFQKIHLLTDGYVYYHGNHIPILWWVSFDNLLVLNRYLALTLNLANRWQIACEPQFDLVVAALIPSSNPTLAGRRARLPNSRRPLQESFTDGITRTTGIILVTSSRTLARNIPIRLGNITTDRLLVEQPRTGGRGVGAPSVSPFIQLRKWGFQLKSRKRPFCCLRVTYLAKNSFRIQGPAASCNKPSQVYYLPGDIGHEDNSSKVPPHPLQGVGITTVVNLSL